MPILPHDPAKSCGIAGLPDVLLAVILGKLSLDDLPSARAVCREVAETPIDSFLQAVFEGYSATPTTDGVSRATTRAVVTGSLAVLGLDYVLTAIMFSEV